MKPTLEEAMKVLGRLASCLAVPASDDMHDLHVVKPVLEAESAYMDALDILTRYHN